MSRVRSCLPAVRQAALLALVLLPMAAGAAHAGDWGLELDNDRFVNTDRHFTHGTRFFWRGDRDDTPDWAYRLADSLPPLDGPGELRIAAALGQNMFTPDDISDPNLIPDDRPYAGWLYGALALTRQTEDKRRTLELDIGVVGPASLARQTQIFVHEVMQTTKPRGWSNQLKNEPGIVLVYDEIWKYRLASFGSEGIDKGGSGEGFGDGLSLVATPHVSGSLGNIYTYAGFGGSLLFGDIDADTFGPARIRPGVPGSDAIADGDGFSWYLFAGADGRYVARNIFLDGNTFTDSHSIDKEPFVIDFQAGATLTFHGTRLTVMQVFRTREFKGQDEADSFGVFEIAFRF